MDAKKKGTLAERTVIRELIKDDCFRTSPRYATTWVHMFNAAAHDAYSHCTVLVKTLARTKIDRLKNIPLPQFRPDRDHNLSIPAISFVFTKIYNTFDTNLCKVGTKSLNGSHCHDWIRQIRTLTKLLSESSVPRHIHFCRRSVHISNRRNPTRSIWAIFIWIQLTLRTTLKIQRITSGSHNLGIPSKTATVRIRCVSVSTAAEAIIAY